MTAREWEARMRSGQGASMDLVPDEEKRLILAPMRLDVDGFGHWLAGFIDGEGSFQIGKYQRNKSCDSYGCWFKLGLRIDDTPILESVMRRLGIGTLYAGAGCGRRKHSYMEWRVFSKSDTYLLTLILDSHPLRAKKAHDYWIWRRAVMYRETLKAGSGTDWQPIIELKRELEEGRRYEEARRLG